ncbi:uncharacterized [Tachysurus ichikawai]
MHLLVPETRPLYTPDPSLQPHAECSRCLGPLIFYFIGSNSMLDDMRRTATSQEGSQVQRDSFFLLVRFCVTVTLFM